jgi:hypothetical protein
MRTHGRLFRRLPIGPFVAGLMRLTYIVVLFQMVALGASSCSKLNSPMDPLSGANPIDGTQFANQAPEIGMSAEICTSDVNGFVVTDFLVRVAVEPDVRPVQREGDEPISSTSPFASAGISVYVTGPSGRIDLVKQADPWVHKAYRDGYTPGVFTIVVQHGGKTARTASVTSPDLHSIDSHAPNDRIEAGRALEVTWSSVSRADEMFAETQDIAIGPRPDNGHIIIPTQGNPARNDQFIQVSRVNRATLPNKINCEVVAKVRHRVEPIIAQ